MSPAVSRSTRPHTSVMAIRRSISSSAPRAGKPGTTPRPPGSAIPPGARRAVPGLRRVRVGQRGQIGLRAIDVEHLPQPDHRNTVRAAAREVDEHLRGGPDPADDEFGPDSAHAGVPVQLGVDIADLLGKSASVRSCCLGPRPATGSSRGGQRRDTFSTRQATATSMWSSASSRTSGKTTLGGRSPARSRRPHA